MKKKQKVPFIQKNEKKNKNLEVNIKEISHNIQNKRVNSKLYLLLYNYKWFYWNFNIENKKRAKTSDNKEIKPKNNINNDRNNINKNIKNQSKIPKKKKSNKKIFNNKDKKNRNKNVNKTFEKNKEEEESIDSIDEENKNKKDLYSILGVSKTANNEEIRSAYRRLVLIYHPDKNKTDPNATSKFIELREAYKILSNYKTRNIYDETGEYDEEQLEHLNRYNTTNDFRRRFTIDDINNYQKIYKGSKEEIQDLINYYNQKDGNISHILQSIPYAENKDIKRYLAIYEKLFTIKKLRKNKNYEESRNKIILMVKNKKEEKEAKEILEKLTKQIMERKNKKRNYKDYLLDLARNVGVDKVDKIKNKMSENEIKNFLGDIKKFKKKNNKNKK